MLELQSCILKWCKNQGKQILSYLQEEQGRPYQGNKTTLSEINSMTDYCLTLTYLEE